MLRDKSALDSFVEEVEPRLRNALIPTLGLDGAREATAEALGYGGEGEVWFSESGRTWEKTATLDHEGELGGVVVGASDTGFLAAATLVGPRGDWQPIAWHSPDGRTWEPVPYEDVSPPNDRDRVSLRKVIPFSDGFLIVGGLYPDKGEPRPLSGGGSGVWIYEQ